MTLESVSSTLHAYAEAYPSERSDVQLTLNLLDSTDQDLLDEKSPVHLTTQAVLVHPRDGSVLLVKIPARYVPQYDFPGGHVGDQDESLAAASLRHLAAATHLNPDVFTTVPGRDATPVEFQYDPWSGPDSSHWHHELTFAWGIQPDCEERVLSQLPNLKGDFWWVERTELLFTAKVQRKILALDVVA